MVMDGVPTATPLPAGQPTKAPLQVKLQPTITFPKDGQYTVFVSYQPAGGGKQTLALPVTVGTQAMSSPALSPDASLTQQNGAVSVTLRTDAPLQAGQPSNMYFDVTDAQGNPISSDIGMRSGNHLALYVVDEQLATYLHPEVVDSSTLQYSITFPKVGLYKVWFEYLYDNQPQQTAFIIDVK
jgi:hypothetical protein